MREDGSDLKGSVGFGLMPQIRELLGQEVTAKPQNAVVEQDSGGRSRPTCRLLALSVDDELLGTTWISGR